MTAPDFNCSMVAAAHLTVTSPITFRKAMEFIRAGRWDTQVSTVRKAYASGGKEAAAEPKKRLPGILFSGTFSARNADALTAHSGLICIDLDDLNGTTDAVKEHIVADPHTLAAFVSPTGSGLKVIFRCDPTKPHAEAYRAAENYVLTHFGLPIDKACKDVSRLCFISSDPEAFIAEDATPLPYPEPTPVEFHPPVLGLDLRPGDDYDSRHDLTALLLKHGWTKTTGGFTRPGKSTGLSATFDKVPGRLHVFSSNAEPFLANHNYKPWHAYALLEHGGDFSAAARDLGKLGYGTQAKSRQQQNLDRIAGPVPDEVIGQGAYDETRTLVKSGPELVAKSLMDFKLPALDDPSVLIGNRWLSRGDIFILASTSGMGKSSLSIQAATTWALGRPLFGGFKPSRPLRSLMFQSEDSEGDVAEVRLSLEHAMKLTAEEIQQVRERVLIVTDRVHRGLSFRTEIKAQLAAIKEQQDIVWVNPLLAFMGGDVKDSTDVGLFIREQLNSLNEPPKFAYGIVHHANKPPKEKKERQWNEVMYEMTGSADLTNAARAIISLQATATEGEFNLILAKRGTRAGLTKSVPGVINANIKFDQPTSSITIKHSTERMKLPDRKDDIQVIHWERCEPTESTSSSSKGGRPSKYSFDEFGQFMPKPGEAYLPANVIHKKLASSSGISPSAFRDLLAKAFKEMRIDRKEMNGTAVYGYKVETGGNGGNLLET